VVLVRPEAYVAESARENVFTIGIILNAFQKLPVSALGDRNPLFKDTTGTEQTPTTSRFFLSSIRPGMETRWCWLHSLLGLSPPCWDAQQAHDVVFRGLLFYPSCSPQPPSVVWWGCGWRVAGEVRRSIQGPWGTKVSWNLFSFLLIDSPGNHLSDGLVLSCWSSVTLLQKLFLYWEGWVCFVEDICFVSFFLACFDLHFPETRGTAVLFPFYCLPPALLCSLLTQYPPKPFLLTGLCLAVDCKLQPLFL